jgi:hypothetical protein
MTYKAHSGVITSWYLQQNVVVEAVMRGQRESEGGQEIASIEIDGTIVSLDPLVDAAAERIENRKKNRSINAT